MYSADLVCPCMKFSIFKETIVVGIEAICARFVWVSMPIECQSMPLTIFKRMKHTRNFPMSHPIEQNKMIDFSFPLLHYDCRFAVSLSFAHKTVDVVSRRCVVRLHLVNVLSICNWSLCKLMWLSHSTKYFPNLFCTAAKISM